MNSLSSRYNVRHYLFFYRNMLLMLYRSQLFLENIQYCKYYVPTEMKKKSNKKSHFMSRRVSKEFCPKYRPHHC